MDQGERDDERRSGSGEKCEKTKLLNKSTGKRTIQLRIHLGWIEKYSRQPTLRSHWERRLMVAFFIQKSFFEKVLVHVKLVQKMFHQQKNQMKNHCKIKVFLSFSLSICSSKGLRVVNCDAWHLRLHNIAGLAIFLLSLCTQKSSSVSIWQQFAVSKQSDGYTSRRHFNMLAYFSIQIRSLKTGSCSMKLGFYLSHRVFRNWSCSYKTFSMSFRQTGKELIKFCFYKRKRIVKKLGKSSRIIDME